MLFRSQVYAITSDDEQFHPAMFKPEVLLPGGSTTIQVIFLPRTVGAVDASLTLSTSAGDSVYAIQAHAVPNPYRLHPFTGAKVPLGLTYSHPIYAECRHDGERDDMAGKAEEVTWEDQQHICAFGRFNTRLHEVNAELKAKSKMVEDLEEASNELIIADDDSVRFSVGETFVTVDNDDAETMLQAQLDEVGAEVTALEKEKKEITSAMADQIGRASCRERV